MTAHTHGVDLLWVHPKPERMQASAEQLRQIGVARVVFIEPDACLSQPPEGRFDLAILEISAKMIQEDEGQALIAAGSRVAPRLILVSPMPWPEHRRKPPAKAWLQRPFSHDMLKRTVREVLSMPSEAPPHASRPASPVSPARKSASEAPPIPSGALGQAWAAIADRPNDTEAHQAFIQSAFTEKRLAEATRLYVAMKERFPGDAAQIEAYLKQVGLLLQYMALKPSRPDSEGPLPRSITRVLAIGLLLLGLVLLSAILVRSQLS